MLSFCQTEAASTCATNTADSEPHEHSKVETSGDISHVFDVLDQ